MTPVACMITDRVRLARHAPDDLVAAVRAAARAGVHLVQIRERDLEGRALYDLARACIDAVRGTRTRIIVNERLDVAVAAGAHGVHLRGDSLPASRARTITPAGFLIGRSVHDADEAARESREGALDYVVFGPVFATESKPGEPAAGLPALADVVAATSVPVLAVGGITTDRIAEIVAAGASGYAAIGMFARSEPR